MGLYQRDSFEECGALTSCATPGDATSSEGGASVASCAAVSCAVTFAPGSPATTFDSEASAAGASPSDGGPPVPGPSAGASRLMRRAARIGGSGNDTSK